MRWLPEIAAMWVLGLTLTGVCVREQGRQARRQIQTSSWVDAMERAEARWSGRSEQGEATLEGFPSQAEWSRCREEAPDCSQTLAAMAVFAPSGPEAGLQLLERVGTEGFLSGGERTSRSVLALSWTHERSPDLLFNCAVSVACRADVLLNRADGAAEPEELVLVIATIRRGDPPLEGWWQQPGLAGMLALELGRAGRAAELPEVLQAAVQGPTSSDRLAALWAARRLAPVERWAHPQAQERARSLGW